MNFACKKDWTLIIGITLFALIIRMYFFNRVTTDGSQDPYWLAYLAKGILQGEYQKDYQFQNIIMPLYPFLMAILGFLNKDYLLSGKIISLLSGVSVIPVTYFLWKRIESKEVALLTAWLIAVNPLAWGLSIRSFGDSLFLFLATLSFLLLFKTRDSDKWLLILAVTLGLATLTRGEGYLLAMTCVLTLFYWRRKGLIKQLRTAWRSVIAYPLLVVPWIFISRVKSGEFFPGYFGSKIEQFGHLGLSWISYIYHATTIPIFLISIGGCALSYRKKGEHMPFYIFFILFSLSHMYFHGGVVRYALPLLPILMGWFSLAIFHSFKNPQHKEAVLIGVIGISFIFGVSAVSKDIKAINKYEVIKEAMVWVDTNTEKDAKIFAGDEAVYGYYTDNEVLRYVLVKIYAKLVSSGLVESAYFNLLVDNNVHYFVVYDSVIVPEIYYKYTKVLADNFTTHKYSFQYKEANLSVDLVGYYYNVSRTSSRKDITLVPLKRFEKQDNTVYLYKVEWE